MNEENASLAAAVVKIKQRVIITIAASLWLLAREGRKANAFWEIPAS